MLATALLLVTSLAAFSCITRAFPETPTIVRAPAGFLLAIVGSAALTYLVALALADSVDDALNVGIWASIVVGAVVLGIFGRHVRPRHVRLPLLDAALTAVTLVIAWWFMQARLRVEDDQLVVPANTWGDTALHVSLARSFSVGDNIPTEYPFFAHEPIHYHFGFDFFAGVLQKGGMSVLWSFNLPGIIGFASLMLLTFAIARLLFSDDDRASRAAAPASETDAPAPGVEPDVPGAPTKVRAWRDRGVWVGLVAIVLFLTNQSLAWLRYVEEDGKGSVLRALNPSTLWKHEGYLTVGPYKDEPIAIFNTLNPFLGQTHLIVAVGVILVLIYLVLWILWRGTAQADWRRLAGLGTIFGALFWLNGVAWIAAAVFFAALLGAWAIAACMQAARAAEHGRWPAVLGAGVPWLRAGAAFAVPALALAVPQALLLSGGANEGLSLHLGYLTCSASQSSCNGGDMNPASLADWWSFIEYWWLNQGLALPLLAAAFVLGQRRDRRLIGAVMAIFLFGNLVAVSSDIGGHGHKVFNLWETLTGLFVAFALVQIWRGGRRRATRIGRRIAVVAAAFFLTISGVVDLMTVKNDFVVSVFGEPFDRDATDWMIRETSPRATFLTDYDLLYTNPTRAGRRLLLGYTPWAGGAGYDVESRKPIVTEIYETPDRVRACQLLTQNRVDYAVIGRDERTSSRMKLDNSHFNAMPPAATFGSGDTEIRIFRIADHC